MSQTLLLTGATGFLGSAFYLNACELGYAADCLLLVRGESDAQCRQRLAQRLAHALGAERATAAANACAIVRGDLHSLETHPDPRLDRIDRVAHFAADTSFTAQRQVWTTNVDGTLALARRARRMPRLQRFLHVGTAFCCGEAPRNERVSEASPPVADTPHIVEYTRSKAAAEAALAAEFPDLPIVVARPSIVIGHSRLGCAASSSIFWYFRVIDRTGLLPCRLDGTIDVVTSDWAAQKLHELLFARSLKHRLYQVSAGPVGAAQWHDMATAFEKAGHVGARPYTPFDPDAPSGWQTFRSAFALQFPQHDRLHRAMVRAARTYHRFVAQNVVFDDARLRAENLAPARPFPEYVAACLEYLGGSIESQFLDDAEAFGVGRR